MSDTSLTFDPILTREEIKAREARRRQILQRLDAKRATLRLETIAECQRLSPYEIGMLVALAEREDTWVFPRWFQISADVFIAAVALSSIGCVAYGAAHHRFAFTAHYIAYLSLWAALFIASQCAHAEFHTNRYTARVRGSLRQVVVETQNPDIFPVLMRMLQITNYIQQDEYAPSEKALFDAASRWLLTLSTEQIRAYAIHHQDLYRFLAPVHAYKNVNLTLRILQILEQIGTASAIPAVKTLADDRPLFQKHTEVKSVAQACLMVLQEREKQSRLPETLLRASCAPAVEADTLLHPTTAPPPAPETLLRPVTTQVSIVLPEQLLRSSNIQE